MASARAPIYALFAIGYTIIAVWWAWCPSTFGEVMIGAFAALFTAT